MKNKAWNSLAKKAMSGWVEATKVTWCRSTEDLTRSDELCTLRL